MNQYVWVPVAKKDFVTKFVRQNFGESYTISNTLGTDYWEVVIDMSTNMPLSTSGINDTNYMTSTTLKEVQAMYESVKEYEGFYIARYEAGIDNQRKSNNGVLETNVYSMMGKIPYTLVPWAKNNSMSEDIGGAVEVARNIYPETNSNYGVVSTLTYGVQWDRTLAWWLEVKAKDGAGNIVTSVTDSTAYGNYRNHVITKEDLNDGARYALYNDSDNDKILGNYQDYQQVESIIKEKGTPWALSTGALKAASVNNIYDMAGNMNEWTMEGLSNMYRVYRGGNYYYAGSLSQSGYPVSNRVVSVQPDYAHFNIGLRISLYIKK